MIGLDGAPDADMNIRAAALELAVNAYEPDEVMVATPGARVLPAADEIVETAKVFEAYLRGADNEEPDSETPEHPTMFGPFDDHLGKCRSCRNLAAVLGIPVPPWMGGRSGG
ncbi:hypothetical protein Aph02nite_17200 [Actinoplanes philippinensis]|uniref:Uncharacterized protein n=1 Tax=Actinoplanes philippinensis TaxID=35752 RepID=A0A1I2B993_9ACTN|nr:hypothetical protein [Actinoplanes philippinensis]GIE75770.1 hypothetical protein Aph02nite_17200 [Actinoplanes philippinensis]SFE52701.1 hypothetical protein SAMN05421541_102184 [Actinoplanes philippinensis]